MPTFRFINFDKRQIVDDVSGKLAELFGSGSTAGIVEYFIIPRSTASKPPPPSLASSTVVWNGRCPLEIMEMIFANVDDASDLICLCVSCKIMLDIGRKHFDAMYRSLTWAGDRAICICEYSRYPPDEVVTAEEKKEIKDSQCGGVQYFADQHYRKVRLPILFPRDDPRFVRMTPDEQVMMKVLTDHDFSGTRDEATQWILCNNSQRQYVTATAVTALNDECPVECAPFFRAGDCANFSLVLLTLMCYSDQGTPMHMDGMRHGDISDGPWAGDRLELTTVDRMDPPIDSADMPWKDISKRVCENVRSLMDDFF